MGKTVNVKKDDVLALHNILIRIPTQRLEEASLKVFGFFRVLKKALKPFLDAQSDVREFAGKALEEKQAALTPLVRDLDIANAELKKKPEDAEVKARVADLEFKVLSLRGDIAEIAKPFDKQIAELDKTLKTEMVDLTFDNEDFKFVKEAMEKSAGSFFAYQTKDGKADVTRIDLDFMDRIFSIFDSAKAST